MMDADTLAEPCTEGFHSTECPQCAMTAEERDDSLIELAILATEAHRRQLDDSIHYGKRHTSTYCYADEHGDTGGEWPCSVVTLARAVLNDPTYGGPDFPTAEEIANSTPYDWDAAQQQGKYPASTCSCGHERSNHDLMGKCVVGFACGPCHLWGD